jgi:CBS domain-containing protein
MWIPKDLGWMSERLKDGHRVNRITVRDLLRMFKAERRGLNKVAEIRAALESLGLKTDPDFESEWIDGRIHIRLRPTDTSSVAEKAYTASVAVAEPDDVDDEVEETQSGAVALPPLVISSQQEGIVETKLTEPPDPTFRIGNLPAANKALETVSDNDPINKAVTKMLQHDYSQLPIMHGERGVKGVISWRSIGRQMNIGGQCSRVSECRDVAHVVDSNGTLFDAIPTIVKHDYVLVRNPNDNRITGIVTASDLSLQFQQLAEPFLLLREIELHIRQLIQDAVTDEDLAALATQDGGPPPQSINDLSFGSYVRLLQKPQVWAKLKLNIDQASMTSQLEQVRVIRNEVMHFDPDPLTQEQLDTLKNTARFMRQLYELLP